MPTVKRVRLMPGLPGILALKKLLVIGPVIEEQTGHLTTA
jgi:hypothetical protein